MVLEEEGSPPLPPLARTAQIVEGGRTRLTTGPGKWKGTNVLSTDKLATISPRSQRTAARSWFSIALSRQGSWNLRWHQTHSSPNRENDEEQTTPQKEQTALLMRFPFLNWCLKGASLPGVLQVVLSQA